MSVDLQDLMNLLAEICDEKNLQVCFKETLKGAALTGVTTAICGLLLGPVGLAVGGIIGGGTSAVLSRGKFQPIGTVLMKLDVSKRQKLYERLKYAFRNFGAKDVATIMALIISQTDTKQLAITVVRNFLTSDMLAVVKN